MHSQLHTQLQPLYTQSVAVYIAATVCAVYIQVCLHDYSNLGLNWASFIF